MPDEKTEPVVESVSLSNWEIIDRVPTSEEVIRLLTELGTCYGVSYVEYADYVQALPQKKKTKRPVEGRPNLMQDVNIDTWTLYMTVAGRIKMLSDIAAANDWVVEIEPEPFTPTQIPGMLQYDERIVYREYVSIKRVDPENPFGGEPVLLGRRPGTAWVPAVGGKNAAGSNPFEKVETAARGRAIAAWGIGVLPGSGVASVEEMLGARENQRAQEHQEWRQGAEKDVKMSRDDTIASIQTLSEELRQERGIEPEESHEKTVEYLQRIGVREPVDESGGIVWDNVKTGQLVLMRNSLRTALAQLRDARSEI